MGDELENASKVFNSSIGVALGFTAAGALSMLTRVVLARLLEPSGYGVLSEALAVMTFLTTFSLLGTHSGVTRFLSHRDGSKNPLGASILITAPLSIISAVAVYLLSGRLAAFMGSPGLEPALEVFALNVPALAVLSVFVSGFRGRKKTLHPIAIRDVAVPLVILVASVSLALVSPQPHYAAAGYVLSSWIGAAVCMALYLKDYSISLPSRDDLADLVDFSVPVWVSDLFELGIVWSNILIVGYLLDSSMAGIYNAALPVSYAITFGLSSISFLIMPLMSTLHEKQRTAEMESLYQTVERWLVVSALPVVTVMALEAEFIMGTVFGSAYRQAAALLVILTIGRFIDVFMGPLGQMVIAFGETRWEAFSRLAGFTTIAAGSFALTPLHGILGAGISYAGGLAVSNVLRLWKARSYGDFNPLSPDYAKPVAAATAASIVLLATGGDRLTVAVSVAVYLATYITLLLGSRPLKPEDIHSLEQLLDRAPWNTDKILGLLKRFQE